MSKKIFLLGMAVAALASCTNEEVMEVAENRAIGFSTFVNNNTRVTEDVTSSNIKAFWVFGDYADGTTNVDVFNNVKVTGQSTGANATWNSAQTAYWQIGKTYQFAGYADGTSALANDKVSFDQATKTLKFTGYTAGDNDLIAGLATDQSWNGSGEPQKVAFTFKHMLSKITFTFKTNAADTYVMNVTELKIAKPTNPEIQDAVAPVKTASGSITDNTNTPIVWNVNQGTTNGEYAYNAIDDYAEGPADVTTGYFSKTTEGHYVIPQGNKNLYAIFTVKMSSVGTDNTGAPTTVELGTRTFTVNMKYQPAQTAEAWKPGMHYNYIAEVNPDDVKDNLQSIQFTVTEVDAWQNADATTTSPQKQPVTP